MEYQALVKHNWGMGCFCCKFVSVKFGFVTVKDTIKVCRIQLAVNVQIPVDFGGLGGKAIYIGKSHDVINGFQVLALLFTYKL